MKTGLIRIHVIAPLPGDRAPDPSLLTPEEMSRAAAFRHPEDASRWAYCRAALRRTLGEVIGLPPAEVPLDTTDFGKPRLAQPFENLHFNLSHCADLAIVALCLDGAVGVDVEPTSRAAELLGCESSFCHPDELAELPPGKEERAMRLLEIWTSKEALLKAAGTGLAHPPERIRLLTTPTEIRVSPATIPRETGDHDIRRLGHRLPGGHTAAICHPRVSRIFEVIPPLESTNAVGSRTLPSIDTRSDG